MSNITPPIENPEIKYIFASVSTRSVAVLVKSPHYSMIYAFYLFNRDGIFLYSEEWNRCVCCTLALAWWYFVITRYSSCHIQDQAGIKSERRAKASLRCSTCHHSPNFPLRARLHSPAGLLFSLKGFAEKLSNKDGCAMHSYKTGYLCILLRSLPVSLPASGLTSCTFLTR